LKIVILPTSAGGSQFTKFFHLLLVFNIFLVASLCCCILALPLVTRYGVKLTFLFGTASAAAAALFLGLLCQLSQLHDSWAGKLSAAVYIAAQVRDVIKHFCQYTVALNKTII
jgi:hypothetical protein